MSSLMSKFKNLIAPQDEYDDEDLEEDVREVEHPVRSTSYVSPLQTPKVVTLNQSNKMEILNFTMLTYEMTGEICGYIKAKKPIIVNMEKLAQHEMQRSVDFLTGACCALNGTVEKITDHIFIFAPENVHINPDKLRQKSVFTSNL